LGRYISPICRYLFWVDQDCCVDDGVGSMCGSNNILYPREDREKKVLLYACRNCDHQVRLFQCVTIF